MANASCVLSASFTLLFCPTRRLRSFCRRSCCADRRSRARRSYRICIAFPFHGIGGICSLKLSPRLSTGGATPTMVASMGIVLPLFKSACVNRNASSAFTPWARTAGCNGSNQGCPFGQFDAVLQVNRVAQNSLELRARVRIFLVSSSWASTAAAGTICAATLMAAGESRGLEDLPPEPVRFQGPRTRQRRRI